MIFLDGGGGAPLIFVDNSKMRVAGELSVPRAVPLAAGEPGVALRLTAWPCS
jgi:hypothetical protein